MRLTAAVTEEDGLYVARCLEVEVTSQGETLHDARSNLIEALELYFEGEADVQLGESPMIVPFDIAV
jgi:predicted RNase H-like HicB family nuclease